MRGTPPTVGYRRLLIASVAVITLASAYIVVLGCSNKGTESRCDDSLEFSGYCWKVKHGGPYGPGPNFFSRERENVFIDELGLHLRTTKRDSTWYCAEVYLDQSLGYGVYTYQLASRVDSFDYQVVASGFLYGSTNRELDIEFSLVLAEPNNAQYVVQPYYLPGHLVTFDMPPVDSSTHRILWTPDSVGFTTWRGHANDPDTGSIISSWTYGGTDIPPEGRERMRFNLWLFNGEPPVGGKGDELVVSSFSFRPALSSR